MDNKIILTLFIVFFITHNDLLQASSFQTLSLYQRREAERQQGVIPVRYPRTVASQESSRDLDCQLCKKAKIDKVLPCAKSKFFTFTTEHLESSECKIKERSNKIYKGELTRRINSVGLHIQIDAYISQKSSLSPEVRKLYNDMFNLEQRVLCDSKLTQEELTQSFNRLDAKFQEVKFQLSVRGYDFFIKSLESIENSIKTFDHEIKMW